MELWYDQAADALYVRVKRGVVVDRTEQLDQGTLVDLDRHGAVVGIEVLNPARRWPLDDVVQRFAVDAPTVLALRAVFDDESHLFPFGKSERARAVGVP